MRITRNAVLHLAWPGFFKMTVLCICMTTGLPLSPPLQWGWSLYLCLFHDSTTYFIAHVFICMCLWQIRNVQGTLTTAYSAFLFCSVLVCCSMAAASDCRWLMTAYTARSDTWIPPAVVPTAGCWFPLVIRGGWDGGLSAGLGGWMSFQKGKWVCRKREEGELSLGRLGIVWLDISYETKTPGKDY